MPNFQSKCVLLSANSVFAVQNSGTYLPANSEVYLYIQLKLYIQAKEKENYFRVTKAFHNRLLPDDIHSCRCSDIFQKKNSFAVRFKRWNN